MNKKRIGQVTATVGIIGIATAVSLYIGVRYAPAYFAVKFAPAKTAQAATDADVRAARAFFWQTFENGRYDESPQAISRLTAAYIQNPRDPETTLLLGLAHLWRLGERARLTQRDPRITEHAVLAEKYLKEAQRLAPDDARIPGWLGSVQLALGKIDQNEKLVRTGYYTLRDGVRDFPEFNAFTLGYALSRLPATDPKYREAVDYMWTSLRACRQLDPDSVDGGRFLSAADAADAVRACWNGPKAPHNVEGFFLNMGDMLVKAGDVALARKIYRYAELSPTYAQWQYKDVLEQHSRDADARAARFRDPDPNNDPAMMIDAAYDCMACHQK